MGNAVQASSELEDPAFANYACCLQDSFTVPSVSGADSRAVSVQLQNAGHNVPADNVLSAVATYAAASGEPRTAALQANAAPAVNQSSSCLQACCINIYVSLDSAYNIHACMKVHQHCKLLFCSNAC